MNQFAINRMLLESLADRYIPKIQFDPHRSIRKLVDLGEYLSHGKTQKHFFQAAQKLLEKENSPYYALIQRVISQVDASAIKTIAMNLGFNSWAALASRKTRDVAPPWTLMFHLSGSADALSMDQLLSLMKESASLGIHTFLLWMDHSYGALDSLVARVRSLSDCAIALFTPADLIGRDTLGEARQARNLLLSIEDSSEADPEPATRALRSMRCPFAVHTVYNTPSEAENILCGNWLERVNRFLSPFAFFLPGASCPEESHQAVREYARRLRTAPQHPVFSMSLCDDIADVDRMITGKPRLMRIKPDGTVDPGIRPTLQPAGQDVPRISLADVLSQYKAAASAI